MLLIFPISSFAVGDVEMCSENGYTVATINGVFTDKQGAGDNLVALKKKLGPSWNNEEIRYEYFLNPSHLGGLDDILKSVYQGLFDSETVQDYDLVEMLKSASEKVQTQKILLVGHSQGNFYANSFYDTVAGKVGGVPAESIGVYSVATPSGRVAGGGRWITSDTDKVIAGVVARVLSRTIMKPNTHIELQPGDDSLGHNFSTIYLKYRSAEIISDIQASLDKLQTNNVQNVEGTCLSAPKLTLGHEIVGVVFAVADPIAAAGNTAVVAVATGIYDAGSSAFAAVASIFQNQNSTLISRTGAGVPPPPTPVGVPVPQQESPTKNLATTPQSTAQTQPQPIPPSQTQAPAPTLTGQTAVPARFVSTVVSSQGGWSGGIGIVEGNTAHGTDSSDLVPTSQAATTTSMSTSAATTDSASSSEATSTSTATSTSSVQATTTTPTPTPVPVTPLDTGFPDLSFAISSCAFSLSVRGCLIATTTVALNWSSSSPDIDHYSITCTVDGITCSNFNLAFTTATSTVFHAPADNATYVFFALAVDRKHRTSAPKVKVVSISTRPIVINEIAWAGTSSTRSEDEWIELYNTTDQDISLTNLVLRSATDNTPYIRLSGTIARKNFFVLERTDDTTVSDRAADQIYTGSLSNAGEVLELSYASTTMDKTPPVCGGSVWCYGSAGPNYVTMERYDPYAAGDNQFNWGSWVGFGASSKNAENAAVHGTPGRRNSLNYLINKSSVLITADKTLKKSESPYVIVPTNFSVSAGVTLNVEAGVVIKFFGAGSLTVDGIIKTHGTASDPVVFTSINDDAYGGDVNNDGSTNSPQAGDWNTIQPNGNGSIIDYAIIRYGGKLDLSGSVQAQLQASNVAIAITNSISELSATSGLWLNNVSGEVSSSTIRDNRALPGNNGMRVSAGTLAIRNNLFQRNGVGLFVAGSSSQTVTVSGNTYTDNNDPIDYYGGLVSFSGNSAAGNTRNGIVVKGAFLNGGTLGPDLPYIMDNDANKSVSPGTTLAILPGTIVKFTGAPAMYVDGVLAAQGTVTAPIVFTSVHDDDCGIAGGCGDTDNATTSPQAGDWGGVIFRASGSATSSLDHVIVRYGGNKDNFNNDRGAVAIQNGTALVRISNATIEKSFFAGVVVSGTASTTITDSIIRDNRDSFGGGAGYGASLGLSANPLIANTHFSNNGQNIATSSNSSWTDGGGNVFE